MVKYSENFLAAEQRDFYQFFPSLIPIIHIKHTDKILDEDKDRIKSITGFELL